MPLAGEQPMTLSALTQSRAVVALAVVVLAVVVRAVVVRAVVVQVLVVLPLFLLPLLLLPDPAQALPGRVDQAQVGEPAPPAGVPAQARADSSVVNGPDSEAIGAVDSLAVQTQTSASDSLGRAGTAAVATAPDSLVVPEIAPLEQADLWDTGVSSTAAVLMTPVFPGWGQLYVESSWRGMLAFGVEWFYWSNMISRDRQARRARDFGETVEPGQLQDYYNALAEEYWEQMRDFAWWSAGVLLIIALDAYVGAKLFHFDEEPLPVPNDWSGHFGANAPLPPGGRDPLNMVVFRWRKTF